MRLASLALVLISAFAHALLSLLIKRARDKQVFCWLYNVVELVISRGRLLPARFLK